TRAQVDVRAELVFARDFRTEKAAVALPVLHLAERVDELAREIQVDEVRDVIGEQVDLPRQRARSPPQADVESERPLDVEIGVPDLERQIPPVRAEVVELLARGGTCRRRRVDDEGGRGATRAMEADRGRNGVERPRAGIGRRMVVIIGMTVAALVVAGVILTMVVPASRPLTWPVPYVFEPPTELQPRAAEVEFLVGKGR